MLIFPTIFNFFGGEKYGLRSFILRKSNNVSFDLRLINTCLSYAHYIRDVKLLSCNCMPLTLKDNKKIGIEWYQEGKKQLDTTLEKNNKGYKNCERICLAFLSNRIRKVSSLFKYQERQLINEVVKLIWSSRYKDEWYL
jgi:hypothetical protein